MSLKSKFKKFINSPAVTKIIYVKSQKLCMYATLLAFVLASFYNVWPKTKEYNHWLLIPNYLVSIVLSVFLLLLFYALTNFYIWIRTSLGNRGWLSPWEPDMGEYVFPDWIEDKKKRRRAGVLWLAGGVFLYFVAFFLESEGILLNQTGQNLMESSGFLIAIFGLLLLITKRT